MGFIYIIKNDINDKVYIGQTTQNINRRFQKHISDSEKLDLYFYRAIRKYGAEHFYINLLEEVPNNILSMREIYWIKYYDSYNNGYNSTTGGEGCRKIDRDLILELWNKGHSEKEIVQLTSHSPDAIGDILKYEFNIPHEEIMNRSHKNKYSITDEQLLELWNQGMGLYQIHKNFGGNTLHKRLINLGITEEEINLRKIKVHKEAHSESQNKKKVFQYTLKGIFIKEYESIEEAAKKTGINRSGISRACSDEYPSSGGYIWSFIKDKNIIQQKINKANNKNMKKVYQYDKDWNLLAIYNSIAEASRAVGLKSTSSISAVCNKQAKTAKGYYWSFNKE